MDNPLISFAVGCYNQEAFIREAVESAFTQTYSPLEIIISDDCSKDRTFDIVQRMVDAYKGPHTVRLNRNQQNLGIGGNTNRAMELCRGELVILAAGDDISLPERTNAMVQAWNESGRKATSLYSRFVVIDELGHEAHETADVGPANGQTRWVPEMGTVRGFLRRRKPHVAGCAHAISRKLFSVFGPLPATVIYEDTALCFRTVLAGGFFAFIDAALVKYRRHGRNITFGLHQARPRSAAAFDDVQKKARCELDRFVEVYKGFAADAERAVQQGLISSGEYPAVEENILKEIRRFELRKELLFRGWLRRWSAFCELHRGSIRPREFLTQLPHLLPRAVHRNTVVALNRLHR